MSNEQYRYYVIDGIFHVRYLNFLNCHLFADCSIHSFHACLRIQFGCYLRLKQTFYTNILHLDKKRKKLTFLNNT